MSGRRRVGSLLALAVLSTLLQRPMHPYEVASLLRARGKEADMAIKWGSLYTVVRNLAKHGLIEVVEASREGARPERTVYRITDEGRAEVTDWVRELISTPLPEPRRFRAGLSVFAILGPEQAARLLRTRLESLEASAASIRASLAEHGGRVPRLFLVEDEYELAMCEAESAWVRSLADELEAGTFPGLAQWRAYLADGTMPPEVAAAAEWGSVE